MDILETFNFYDDYIDCMETDFFSDLEKILDNFDKNSIEESELEIENIFRNNESKLSYTEIPIGNNYYRARIGCNHVDGTVTGIPIDVTFPFYASDIGAPPTRNCKSGRCNRESFYSLYLATSKETCVSELKLDVGQVCSIAKFKSLQSGKYIDLRNPKLHSFMYCLNKILLVPVHPDNKYIYYLTQTFSSVIKKLGYRGIIYPSSKNVECEDFNIVSFYPEDFKYIKYSEKLFSIDKIEYSIKEKDESYKRYKDYEKNLINYNEIENNKRERFFD